MDQEEDKEDKNESKEDKKESKEDKNVSLENHQGDDTYDKKAKSGDQLNLSQSKQDFQVFGKHQNRSDEEMKTAVMQSDSGIEGCS